MAMKKIHIILLLALGLGVSSCFTSYISNKQVMGVQQGMTQRDVESILENRITDVSTVIWKNGNFIVITGRLF